MVSVEEYTGKQTGQPFSPPPGFQERAPDTETDPGDEWIVVFRVDIPAWVPFEDVLEGWTADAVRIEREINDVLDGSISVIDTEARRSGGSEWLKLHYRADSSPSAAAVASAISTIGPAALIGLGIAIGLIAISVAVSWKISQADPGGVALGTGAVLLGALFIFSQSDSEKGQGVV